MFIVINGVLDFRFPKKDKEIKMHEDHDIFIQAVKSNKKILLTYYDDELNLYLTRLCIPMNYGKPGSEGGSDYYSFWVEYAQISERALDLYPSQIKYMELSDEVFNPADYITPQKDIT